MNYDASQVGVPYARAYKITIDYPDNGALPTVNIEQGLAVKLADGTVRKLDGISPIFVALDMVNDANIPIPLVSPDNGAALGSDTSLLQTMLAILAVVRQKQIASGQ